MAQQEENHYNMLDQLDDIQFLADVFTLLQRPLVDFLDYCLSTVLKVIFLCYFLLIPMPYFGIDPLIRMPLELTCQYLCYLYVSLSAVVFVLCIF